MNQEAPAEINGQATPPAEGKSGQSATGKLQTDSYAAEHSTSWWGRPCGGREVLALSVPLVISSLSWTVMTFIDRMLLNWVSETAMNAAFSAGTTWFAFICLPMGICAYASTFVSQYFGDKQYGKIGPSVGQGVWAAMIATPLLLAGIPLAPWIFDLAGHESALRAAEVTYLQILLWGAPAMLASQALAAFFSGRSRTNVVMIVDGGSAVINLALDYIMIFGKFGLPAMGIVGAGWATVIALWLKFLIYFALIARKPNRVRFNTISGLRFHRKLFGRLIVFGGPSGVQFLLDVLGFTVFILLVGRLGKLEHAATTMAFSISTLAFMPIYGLSIAASILVGQRLVEDKPELAARATWTTLTIGISYMACMSLLYIFAPELFLSGFLANSTFLDKETLATTAATLLLFVAAYNLFDAMLMIFSAAIKGAGDTRFVLYVSLLMAAILASASWVAVERLSFGVYGCWNIITAWVCIGGVIYLLRFLQGRWKSMRVIEPRVEDVIEHPLGGEELDQIRAGESIDAIAQDKSSTADHREIEHDDTVHSDVAAGATYTE
ncbi:MAG: MATE family efflux transporter [Pirellulales bacterium]|nr:MATE family efflux transporter [Pirellulales bacterium]